MILSSEKHPIILRDWRREDLGVYQFWNTGKHAWMDYDGPYYPKMTEGELKESVRLFKKKIRSGNWGTPRRRMAIADKGTDRLLGMVSWYWQSEETNWKSIGIVIYDEADWGKSIGFHALSLWVGYLFSEDPRLQRLDLRTWSGNHGMMRLGTKLGFQLEARFRKARVVNGIYYDSIGMGILREEWQARSHL